MLLFTSSVPEIISADTETEQGELTIQLTLPEDAPDGDKFRFHITSETTAYDLWVTLEKQGDTSLSKTILVPFGTYTVQEVMPGGYTAEGGCADIELDVQQALYTVVFENTYDNSQGYFRTAECEENVITLYYTAYTVRYLKKDTDIELADSESGGGIVGGTVTAEAKEIAGYMCVSEPQQSITLQRDSDSNIIIFYYEAIYYHITYDGNGNTSGTAPTDSTDYPVGATAIVCDDNGMKKDGCIFMGWSDSPIEVLDRDEYLTIAPELIDEYSEIVMNSDVTLYAVWVKRSASR